MQDKFITFTASDRKILKKRFSNIVKKDGLGFALWNIVPWITTLLTSLYTVNTESAGTISRFSLLTIILSVLSLGANFNWARLHENDEPENVVWKYGAKDNLRHLDSWKTFFRYLGLLLYMELFVFLWSLLFVIPGIIKSFGYSQAFYIYHDALVNGQPLSYKETLAKSQSMMSGNKWQLFVTNVSFIGWYIVVLLISGTFSFALGIPTGGWTLFLVNIISWLCYSILSSYVLSVNAGFYTVLKKGNLS